MRLTIIVSILLTKYGMAEASIVPVLLIDGSNQMRFEIGGNPLVTLSHEVFSNTVHKMVRQVDPKTIIIFAEETLSTHDISTRDKFGTPFSFLHERLKQGIVKYFPAVNEPYSILMRMYAPYRVLGVSSADDLNGADFKQSFYVTFKEAINKTRMETLREHDEIMRKIFQNVQHAVGNSVVALYTGRSSPVVLEDSAFRSNNIIKDESLVIPTQHALFKFDGIHSSAPTRRSAFSQIPTVPAALRTAEHLSITMEYPDFNLQFNFSFTETLWQLDTVALIEDDEEVGHTKMYVGAPWDWSFICGDPLIVPNFRDGSHVSIPFYQIQPFQGSLRQGEDPDPSSIPDPNSAPDPSSIPDPSSAPDPSSNPDPNEDLEGQEYFGPAANCGRYFTSDILACLFIVSICLGILVFGVLMLMDCSPNSRYDDANGKELMVALQAGG